MRRCFLLVLVKTAVGDGCAIWNNGTICGIETSKPLSERFTDLQVYDYPV
jgi:hypothetical protein